MAGTDSPMFLGDSDSDTVSLTSTAASDQQDEYLVEKILYEEWRMDEEGNRVLTYLVKWENYPLLRSTFEPRECFVSEDPLETWEARKQQIAAGKLAPFDIDDFNAQMEKHEQKTARRKVKRAEVKAARSRKSSTVKSAASAIRGGYDSRIPAKKRERLLPRSSLAQDEDDSTDSPTTTKKTTSAPPKNQKKGIAQKRGQRRTSTSSSSSTASVNDFQSSRFSLFNEDDDSDVGTTSASNLASARAANKRDAHTTVSPTTKLGMNAAKILAAEALKNNTPKSTAPTRPDVCAPVSAVKTAVPIPSTGDVMTNTTTTAVTTAGDAAKSRTANAASSSIPTTTTRNFEPTSTANAVKKPVSLSTASIVQVPTTNKSPTPAATTSIAPRLPILASGSAPGLSGVSRKSATTTKMFIDPNAQRKSRQRASGNTQKDSTDPRFRYLSTQWKYQKYGAQNEPAPDLTALKFVDPKTGPSHVDSQRKPSLSAVESPVPVVSKDSELSAQLINRNVASGNIANFKAPEMDTNKKNFTCRRWLRSGRCARGPTCYFSHHMCDRVDIKLSVTCHYWPKQQCKWSAAFCDAFHHDVVDDTVKSYYVNLTAEETMSKNDKEMALKNNTLRQDNPPEPSNPSLSPLEQRSGRASSGARLPIACKEVTCRYWYRGDCNRDEKGCDYAHRLCDVISPKVAKTCNFWKTRGWCKYNDTECQYYHEHPDPVTGLYERSRESETSGDLANRDRPLDSSECHADARFAGDHEPDMNIDMSTSNRNDSQMEQNLVRPGNLPPAMRPPPRSIPIESLPNKAKVAGSSPGLPHHAINLRDSKLKESTAGDAPIEGFSSAAAQHTGIVWPTINLDVPSFSEGRLFRGSSRMISRIVFLMFPPELAAETAMISSHLQKLGAGVLCNGASGTWERFLSVTSVPDTKGRSPGGVILFHSQFRDYRSIKNLWQTQREAFNYFELSFGPTFSCKRLFPHRNMTLITDDVFAHYPAKALRIVKAFKSRNDRKPLGATRDRIWTRPDLDSFLFRLLEQHTVEDYKSGKTDRFELYRLASQLLIPEQETVDPPMNDNEETLGSFIVSPPSSKFPKYEGQWESDEHGATEWLVRYFAGHCEEQRENFRMFTVLHQARGRPDKTPREGKDEDEKTWMNMYRYLLVLKPDKWLEQYAR